MLPDGGNDLLTWWLTPNPCITCSCAVLFLLCLYVTIRVIGPSAGRQLAVVPPVCRHGEMLRLINRRQFCLNNLQTWNWFQKIRYKSSTQCHTTFQIKTTCNLGNHSIDLHGLIYHWKRHQTIYGCFTTTTTSKLFVSAPYTYDVETTIVAITGLFVSTPYTTMLKQQS